MSRPASIAFLTSCPDAWGGSEELWAGAAERLSERGHRVIAGRSEPWPRGRLRGRWAELKTAGIAVRSFGATRFARALPDLAALAAPALLRPTWRLRNLAVATKLRLLAPDLAVISQGQAYDACLSLCLPEVCRFAGVPYSLVCQKASDLLWPPDGLRDLIRRCYREAAAVFFVSEHNRRAVERQLAMDLPRAEIVRNPVMVPADAPLPWPASNDGVLRLACVGRLWPLEKAQDVLLNVLARDRWRERPSEVSFFGEGPMARGLEEMARGMGLTNIRFPGVASPLEIWRTHHALVLPSRSEGLPLVQVEAMMCGRPVIVADAGGTAEIIRDGEHGFLATAATETAVDDALERAWQRRADWQAIGAAAAAHVRTLYPPDPCGTFADRLMKLVVPANRGRL